MTGNKEISITKTLIHFFLIIKEHYGIFATICTVLFTIVCLIFGEVYFRSFGLNHFLFSGLSDIYLTPLSKGVIFLIGIIVLFMTILVFFLAITLKNLNYNGPERREVTNRWFTSLKKITMLIISIGLGGVATLYILWLVLHEAPTTAAEVIKLGFSERYNVETSGKQYLCYSAIGGSSSYMFLWNYSNMRPVIVARSVITSVEQVVPASPRFSLLPKQRRESESIRKLAKEKLLQDQTAWSVLLEKNCSQKVKWPTF